MNVTVWNENVHEKTEPAVLEIHPHGLHETLKGIIQEIPESNVRVATLDMPSAGLPQEVLDATDVLVWWAHMAHEKVPDEVVDAVCKRVLAGMGLIVLHSGHYSKVLQRLLGTTCDLRWRDGAYERLFCIEPSHPIAEGVPSVIELGIDECYGERFDIPKPDDVIFSGWFDIGETFRSGCTWTRGYGKIFYFQPGHETNRSYYNPHVRRIIQNACKWACPKVYRGEFGAPEIRPTLEESRLGPETSAK